VCFVGFVLTLAFLNQFFIHGGNYFQGYGGGPLYDGTPLVNSSDVLLVTINYRLGALGFAYTGDLGVGNGLEGNYGFLDQRLALKWVQSNIKNFGGDPSRVTIFGQSAGSMSVTLHLISAGSRGLYSAAIVESDPFGLPLRDTKNFPVFVKAFAKKANCTKGVLKPKIEISCLMDLPVKQLIEAQSASDSDVIANLDDFVGLFTPWTPVLGTEEIPLELLRGFQSGQIADVPVVIGTVRDEVLEFIYSGFTTPLGKTEMWAVVAAVFGVKYVAKIKDQYPEPANTTDYRNYLAHFANDALFHCPGRNAALSLSKRQTRQSPTFNYHFDHVVSFGAQMWLPRYPECLDKVCHAAELPFIFRTNLSSVNATYTADEVAMSIELEKYWSEFAKNGNFSSGWPQIDVASEQTRLFQAPTGKVETKAYAAKCAFWDDLGYSWLH
jgi:acetylcholinesterase/cholinesterase